jgi:hypothetical protein
LTPDGVGAFPPAVFLGEVVGQAGDDLVAAVGDVLGWPLEQRPGGLCGRTTVRTWVKPWRR